MAHFPQLPLFSLSNVLRRQQPDRRLFAVLILRGVLRQRVENALCVLVLPVLGGLGVVQNGSSLLLLILLYV